MEAYLMWSCLMSVFLSEYLFMYSATNCFPYVCVFYVYILSWWRVNFRNNNEIWIFRLSNVISFSVCCMTSGMFSSNYEQIMFLRMHIVMLLALHNFFSCIFFAPGQLLVGLPVLSLQIIFKHCSFLKWQPTQKIYFDDYAVYQSFRHPIHP